MIPFLLFQLTSGPAEVITISTIDVVGEYQNTIELAGSYQPIINVTGEME